MRRHQLLRAAQIVLGVLDLGLAGFHPLNRCLDRGGGRLDELLGLLVRRLLDLQVGVLADAGVGSLDRRGGLVDRQVEVLGDDPRHHLVFLYRAAFHRVDRLDAAGEGHGDQIGLRQAGFRLFVDEFADAVHFGGGGHRHAPREPARRRVNQQRGKDGDEEKEK